MALDHHHQPYSTASLYQRQRSLFVLLLQITQEPAIVCRTTYIQHQQQHRSWFQRE
jgi:hypothetical protein